MHAFVVIPQFPQNAHSKALAGHELLRRLILETKHPQRCALTIKSPLSKWNGGRITIAGDAAHPASPVSLSGADELVLDARMLCDSFAGLQIPDEIPIALDKYSK